MQQDKKLLLFPVVTGAVTMFIALLFLAPVALQPTGYSYFSGEHWNAVSQSIYRTPDSQNRLAAENPENSSWLQSGRGLCPLAVGYFGVMYFVSMFAATFFNVAFYQQIIDALKGRPVSIAAGLRFAATKWQAILMWTIFAGLVGYLINTIAERFGFIGRLITKFLGTAWSIACVFVIPVIITEETSTNPFEVLKKSAQTLRRTWGESLIGYTGVGLGGGFIVLLSLLWLGAGVGLCVMLHLYWAIVLVALAWLCAMLLLGYVSSVASQIFRCALFLYATEGSLPQPYTTEMATQAWKMKKR